MSSNSSRKRCMEEVDEELIELKKKLRLQLILLQAQVDKLKEEERNKLSMLKHYK